VLIAYDTVDGERHGQLSASRERFPPLLKKTTGAPPSEIVDDTQPRDVPCALNPAFSDSCDSLTCRRATKPLGGACCSGRYYNNNKYYYYYYYYYYYCAIILMHEAARRRVLLWEVCLFLLLFFIIIVVVIIIDGHTNNNNNGAVIN
jgi:hypothetical protein